MLALGNYGCSGWGWGKSLKAAVRLPREPQVTNGASGMGDSDIGMRGVWRGWKVSQEFTFKSRTILKKDYVSREEGIRRKERR